MPRLAGLAAAFLLILSCPPAFSGGGTSLSGREAALADFRAGAFGAAYAKFAAQSLEYPGSQELLGNAAVSARLAGMWAEALAARRQAAALEDKVGWSRLWASRILLAQNRLDEALKELGDGDGAWDHLTRGQILRRKGSAQAAVVSFETALARDPLLYLALQEKGEALETLGRYPFALAAFTSALELDRSLTHLHLRMAGMERKLGQTRESFDRLVRFLLVDPRNPDAMSLKSSLAREFPQYTMAEEARERQKKLDWLKMEAPLFSPLAPAPGAPLAVGIVSDAENFRVKCAGTLYIESGGTLVAAVPPQAEIEGTLEGGLMRLSWSGTSYLASQPVLFRPGNRSASLTVFDIHFAQGYFWSEKENRSYRGALRARRFGKGLSLASVVPLEDYLLSVVPAEMPAGWPLEALKAQAVAARSETLSKIGRHSGEGYDVCSSQHCAVYRGINSEQENSTRAVVETRGETMIFGGKPMPAVYADNCGGWGSSAEEVWGSSNTELPAVSDIAPEASAEWRNMDTSPDLKERFIFSRPKAYCNQPKRPASAFRWVRSFTVEEIGSWADRRFRIGNLQNVSIRSINRQGWVTAVEFTGDKGVRVVEKDAIRGAFSMIKSNFFTLEVLPATLYTPAQIILYGCGWGHGVGMCQTGAYGLAVAGKSWREIIRHYYPAARVKRIY